MKRIPKIGTTVKMESAEFTGKGIVIDIHTCGQSADITIRDAKGRCWTSKKEKLSQVPVICHECYHTLDDCDCCEEDGTPIRTR
jgi:hypothetical protein